jgi:predicted SnoaL-like aldol condensation-catalyzing enzyme
VLEVWQRIFNEHDLSAADELVAEDYRQHTAGVPGGRSGFKQTFARYLAQSPDLHVEPRTVIEIGDLAIIRGRVFMNCPPPGVTSPIEVVDVFRVADGMLQEHWEL